MRGERKIGNLLFSAWDIFWIKADFLISTVKSFISLSIQGCVPGPAFLTSGECHFKARKAQSIQIGRNVTLLGGWRSNRVGISNPILLQTFGDGLIKIGKNSGGSGIVISSRSQVQIGNNVNLGGNTRVFDHDFHALDFDKRRLPFKEQEKFIRSSPINIGDDVFIGANAIILKGATIGPRAIVAAGSVVFQGDYPADTILHGNPATIRQKPKQAKKNRQQ
jgi:acetyltransferase-like isoleucine patch superfamily enzyme